MTINVHHTSHRTIMKADFMAELLHSIRTVPTHPIEPSITVPVLNYCHLVSAASSGITSKVTSMHEYAMWTWTHLSYLSLWGESLNESYESPYCIPRPDASVQPQCAALLAMHAGLLHLLVPTELESPPDWQSEFILSVRSMLHVCSSCLVFQTPQSTQDKQSWVDITWWNTFICKCVFNTSKYNQQRGLKWIHWSTIGTRTQFT